MTKTGVMAGPIAGLKYETPTHSGLTNERGEFQYEDGERVAFLVGNTAIGNVTGRPRVTLADIVARVDGNIHDHLFDLSGVGLDRLQAQGGNYLRIHRAAHEMAEHALHAHDYLV